MGVIKGDTRSLDYGSYPCKEGTTGNRLRSLKGHPNQTGNLHYGRFGDRYFKQVP